MQRIECRTNLAFVPEISGNQVARFYEFEVIRISLPGVSWRKGILHRHLFGVNGLRRNGFRPTQPLWSLAGMSEIWGKSK